MLDINKLQIKNGDMTLVDVSFKLSTKLGIIGQSGSGKSLILKTILGMHPPSLEIEFDYSFEEQLVRGKNIAFVPQNPFTALSPLTKIKDQFFISIQKIHEVFDMVNLDYELLDKYPPQLSGGQLQRVIIAQAIVTDAKIILFDEPTTALDSKNVDTILDLINNLQKELSFKMIFVTHDIDVASRVTDEVIILKNGLIVETGVNQTVFNNPQDRYTKLLIDSNFKNREFRS